MLQYQALFVTF